MVEQENSAHLEKIIIYLITVIKRIRQKIEIYISAAEQLKGKRNETVKSTAEYYSFHTKYDIFSFPYHSC